MPPRIDTLEEAERLMKLRSLKEKETQKQIQKLFKMFKKNSKKGKSDTDDDEVDYLCGFDAPPPFSDEEEDNFCDKEYIEGGYGYPEFVDMLKGYWENPYKDINKGKSVQEDGAIVGDAVVVGDAAIAANAVVVGDGAIVGDDVVGDEPLPPAPAAVVPVEEDGVLLDPAAAVVDGVLDPEISAATKEGSASQPISAGVVGHLGDPGDSVVGEGSASKPFFPDSGDVEVFLVERGGVDISLSEIVDAFEIVKHVKSISKLVDILKKHFDVKIVGSKTFVSLPK